jgi:hypothetical protein
VLKKYTLFIKVATQEAIKLLEKHDDQAFWRSNEGGILSVLNSLKVCIIFWW